jgi:hypothetical protein
LYAQCIILLFLALFCWYKSIKAKKILHAG